MKAFDSAMIKLPVDFKVRFLENLYISDESEGSLEELDNG